MDERARRLWAGTDARAGARPEDVVKVRRSSGKRKYELAHPEVWPALENLVDPLTRGDPESSLRWTCKSTRVLADELFEGHGIHLSDKTVAKLLRAPRVQPSSAEQGRRRCSASRQKCPIRAHQRQGEDGLERGIPVISVDTKKKELVGNFKNVGREWQPQGEPELVDVHDFPSDAVGKAIPYGWSWFDRRRGDAGCDELLLPPGAGPRARARAATSPRRRPLRRA